MCEVLSVGDVLKENRKKRGMTLKVLSNRSGVSASFISDVEHSRKNVGLSYAIAIADVLNIDFTLLLKEEVSTFVKEKMIITDPNIRCIIKASKNLTDAECSELRKFAERLFPKYF